MWPPAIEAGVREARLRRTPSQAAGSVAQNPMTFVIPAGQDYMRVGQGQERRVRRA
jgi:hypothetical protein